MSRLYINSNEFLKQLDEKELTIEDIAQNLGLNIDKANRIFQNDGAISALEALKITEAFGFDNSIITSKRTQRFNYEKLMPNAYFQPPNKPKKQPKGYICKTCNYYMYETINFCPFCGKQHPEIIRVSDSNGIDEANQLCEKFINKDVFEYRMALLDVTYRKLCLSLKISFDALRYLIDGKRPLQHEEQLIISEILKTPIVYLIKKDFIPKPTINEL